MSEVANAIMLTVTLQNLKYFRVIQAVYQTYRSLQSSATESSPAGKRKRIPKQKENGEVKVS